MDYAKMKKAQLIEEIEALQERVVELERAETERKRAEEALRESEEEKATILNTMSEHVVYRDTEMRVLWANRAAGQSVDLTPEQLEGRYCYEIWYQRSTPCVVCPAREALKTGQPQEAEVTTPDERIWRIRTYPIRDADGDTVGIANVTLEITERKRAEEALRDSRRMLQTVLDSIPSTVFWKDRDSIYLGANRALLETAGLKSSEEIVGKSDYDLPWGKKQADSFREDDRRVVESGIPEYNIIEPYLRADGTHAWAKTNKVPLRDTEGNVVGILGTSEDITERKRAEEALRESEERFRTIFAQSPVGIEIYDASGKLIDANPACLEMFGVENVEAVRGFDLLADPNVPPEARSRLEQGETVKYETVFDFELVRQQALYRTSRSGQFFVNCLIVPLRASDHSITGYLVHVRDITERKQAEEMMKFLAEVLSSSPLSVVATNKGEKIIYVNPATERLFGYTSDELLGKNPIILNADPNADKIQRDIFDTIGQEKVWRGEILNKKKNGEVFPIYASVYQLLDAKGNFIAVVGFQEDVTERKRAEEALRRSLEETAHGQRTLLALSQAAQAVQRAHTPDEVYYTMGDEVTRLGYNAVVLTLTDDRAHLAISHVTFEPAVVRAAEKLVGVSTQDFRLPLVSGGFLQRIIVEGETAFRSTGEIMAEALPGPLHPLAGQLATLLGLRQSIVARLTVGDEAHGLLVVSGTGLTEADVPAVTAFANQAAIAIENARLFEQVRAAREQLRDLASYLQAAREEERAEIAREIHDEFGQALSALNMDLFWLSKRLPADQPHLAEKASAMSDLIDSTIQTVRHVATELRPGLLDDLGLAAAMEWQAEEFAERTGIDCELYLSNAEIVLDRDLATVIFRIFQETLTNVVRHSEATEVRVELKDRPDELVLIVRDNGRGITESQVSHPRSLGLMGMRERAYSWGGEVAFQGVPGQGTTVTVRIPNSEFEGGYDQSACCR